MSNGGAGAWLVGIKLKRQLWIGERAGHGDIFNRSRPVGIGGGDLRLISQREGHSLAQRRIGRLCGEWSLEQVADGGDIASRLFFTRRGNALTAGEDQSPGDKQIR
jgi:hypothetical protein